MISDGVPSVAHWSEGEQLAVLEACLFACPEPLSPDHLAEVLGVDSSRIHQLIETLLHRYRGREFGVELLSVAGGIQLRTKAIYYDVVQHVVDSEPERLSPAAIETLALVAYRQPITRPEIDQIRGVNTSHLLRRLYEENLIRVLGRKDAPGKPKLYGTTPRFLEQFGLTCLEDLPPLPSDILPSEATLEEDAAN